MAKNYCYRTIISFYLLLLYLIVIVKPIVPIINDAFQHVFAEAIHMATVHAIYGPNHLQKEVADASSDNNKNKPQNSVKAEDLIPAHFGQDEYSPGYLQETKAQYTHPLTCPIDDVFLSADATPPKS